MSATVEYTDPAVFTTGVSEGWAEAETDPTRCHVDLLSQALILGEGVNLLAGSPRSGKSWLSPDLALAALANSRD